jgi:predicted amidophosphoribosyltransferase
MRVCAECGGELEAAYRFCPWCAAPQRSKLVEFFRAHPRDGVAEAAVSLDELEAERLADFLAAPERRPGPIERLLARL